MAKRKPVVVTTAGLAELPANDTINAFFDAPSTALPALTALGSTTITLTVTPRVAGDVLAVGEVVIVTPSAALPAGLNIAYAVVTAANKVEIGLSAVLGIALGQSRAWAICALR